LTNFASILIIYNGRKFLKNENFAQKEKFGEFISLTEIKKVFSKKRVKV